MFVSTEHCIQARIKNVCKSMKELTSWTASQIEAFDTGGVRQYRIRGRPVCRVMWQRYHGIGDKTMGRALKLFERNKTFYLSGGSLSGKVCQE